MSMNWSVILSAFIFVIACTDDHVPTSGSVRLNFVHQIGNEPVRYRSLEYQNTAGNTYEVTNIQWFISRVRFYNSADTFVEINEPFAHYVDSDLPETLNWISERIPKGKYESIAFVFGLDGDHNKPGQFANPPESNMEWPLPLGGQEGGYHYMKLNGFWIDNLEARRPFNMHLGVGQQYDEEGEIVGFVQNWFEVRIPAEIEIHEAATTNVSLIMNIDSWFDSPTLYDLDVFGGMIMTNQNAMRIICENGADAFAVE